MLCHNSLGILEVGLNQWENLVSGQNTFSVFTLILTTSVSILSLRTIRSYQSNIIWILKPKIRINLGQETINAAALIRSNTVYLCYILISIAISYHQWSFFSFSTRAEHLYVNLV